MFEAQYLYKGSSVSVYSPWMRRGGDSLIATVDVIAITSTTTLTVTVFTKENEAEGSGTVVTGSTAATAAGRSDGAFNGTLKDLVRYKFSATEEEESDDPALFRMLDPVWFDDVLA